MWDGDSVLPKTEILQDFTAAGRTEPSGEEIRELIPQLLRQFYGLGWVSGTGGGISIRSHDDIYIAPSGVQKERVHGDDLFIQSLNGDDVCVPENRSLIRSQCTPLFMNAYRMRNAGCVIHTHSKWAALVTMLVSGSELAISHLEMVKGIRDQATGKALRYDQTLRIPIIENTCFEAELKDSMAQAMQQYPSTCAVLVRRHGLYVWGDTWQQAKSMAECYDYLFEMACEMKKHGLALVQQ